MKLKQFKPSGLPTFFILMTILFLGFGLYSCEKDKNITEEETIEITDTDEIIGDRSNGWMPEVVEGVLVFKKLEHFEVFYKKVDKLYEKNVEEFDEFVQSFEIESLKSKFLNDTFEDPNDRFIPAISDFTLMGVIDENYEFRICNTGVVAYEDNFIFYEVDDTETQIALTERIHNGKLNFSNLPEKTMMVRQSDEKKYKHFNFCNPGPTLSPDFGPIGPTGPCDCFITFEDVSCNRVLVHAGCSIPGTNTLANFSVEGVLDSEGNCGTRDFSNFSGFIDQEFTACGNEIIVTTWSGLPSVCPDDSASATWIAGEQVCDTEHRGTDWDWIESGSVALSYQTRYFESPFASKERAHAFSLKKINGNWVYQDVDELSATISANRQNEDDCSQRAFEMETKDCDDCKERVATVIGSKKIAHCNGDVFGSFWLKEGNIIITDYNHQIVFDCCD